MKYWLLKSEPEEYGLAQLLREKRAVWDGIRNYTARNNLRAMAPGDAAVFYHSGSGAVKTKPAPPPEAGIAHTGRGVVGLARVVRAAFPDPKSPAGQDWSAIEIEGEQEFTRALSLADLKAAPVFADSPLLRQSRLSVVPLTKAQFDWVLRQAARLPG